MSRTSVQPLADA